MDCSQYDICKTTKYYITAWLSPLRNLEAWVTDIDAVCILRYRYYTSLMLDKDGTRPFKVTYPLCQVVQSSISQCGGFKIRDLSCNLGAYMNERILKKILISFNRWQLQIMHIFRNEIWMCHCDRYKCSSLIFFKKFLNTWKFLSGNVKSSQKSKS